jgi:hypothetical protein
MLDWIFIRLDVLVNLVSGFSLLYKEQIMTQLITLDVNARIDANTSVLSLWGTPVAANATPNEEGGLQVSPVKYESTAYSHAKWVDAMRLEWTEENMITIKSALAKIVTDVNNAKGTVDFNDIAPFYDYVEGAIIGLTNKRAAREVRTNPRYIGGTRQQLRAQYYQVKDMYLSHCTIAGLAVLYCKHKQGQDLASMAAMMDRYNAGETLTPSDWEAVGLSTYKDKPSMFTRQEIGVAAMVAWSVASHESTNKRYRAEALYDLADENGKDIIETYSQWDEPVTKHLVDNETYLRLGGDKGLDALYKKARLSKSEAGVMKLALSVSRPTRKEICMELDKAPTTIQTLLNRARMKMERCGSEELCNLLGVHPDNRPPRDMKAYVEQLQAPGHICGGVSSVPITPGYVKPMPTHVFVHHSIYPRCTVGYGVWKRVSVEQAKHIDYLDWLMQQWEPGSVQRDHVLDAYADAFNSLVGC